MSEDDIKIELLHESQISQTDNFINFKIIIVGDSGVGKSSLLKRAVQNKFDGNYQATIGFEFLLMHFNVNDLKLKLQIWDTCGQEMYRSLVQGFYRNTSLALVVYDINQKKTYESLDIWLKDIRQHTEQELPIFIAGNKNDLERVVPFEEAKVFAVSNRTKKFTECSAKTGYNVKEIFFDAAKYLYKTYKEFRSQNKLSTPGRLKIDGDKNNALDKKKKKCC
jgi:Ras-related protein Rab-11A